MTTLTLRRLRTELASRLDHLDARAALLEQHAQRFTRTGLTPKRPSLLQRALSVALKIVRHTNRALRRSIDWLDGVRRNAQIATAIRITRGSLYDAAMYLSLACAVLLAFAVVLAFVAPPY